jgi:nicotinamide phosphoribosyltransferase
MYSNIILSSDSYKYSQFNQYPEGTEYVYSYIQSRGGQYDIGVYFGLQAFLVEYMSKPVTMADIDEAEQLILAHGEPFNRAGWEYIVKVHKGILPLEIRGLPEGIKFNPHANIPLVTVVNTDPKVGWLVSFMETALLRAVWYPTTVASNSYASRRAIRGYLEKTGDVSGLDFKLHDFGARGVSSMESAGLGGLAHLATGAMGTDTVSALLAARKYYAADMAGFSIPAMEHSTVTSWGRENEVESYRNMLKLYGKPGAIFAAVSDSYNIYEACKMWGTELKQAVIESGATLVVRPDSGTPHIVVLEVVKLLDQYFGSTINAKGYKVLNHVRVIQGDGINTQEILRICFALDLAGYSIDNVAFGQGGALLQAVNRDTMKFAMKCSAIAVRTYMGRHDELGSSYWRDVYKDPVHDSGKRSMKGCFSVIRDTEDNGDGLKCVPLDLALKNDLLQVRYLDGEMLNKTTLSEVRALANA